MEFDQEMPKILFGDEDRLTYIFTCLLKNAVERNRLEGALKAVNLRVYASPEEQIDFTDSYEIIEIPNKELLLTNLAVIITDYGSYLTP